MADASFAEPRAMIQLKACEAPLLLQFVAILADADQGTHVHTLVEHTQEIVSIGAER